MEDSDNSRSLLLEAPLPVEEEEVHAPSAPSDHDHDHTPAPANEMRDTTLTNTPTPTDKHQKTTTPPTSLPTPHLLLVDDNLINLKILSVTAKRAGCTYDTATGGEEVLETFKSRLSSSSSSSSSRTYDLILMDLCMPGVDGIEATRGIRQYEEEESTASAGTGTATETGLILRKRTRIVAVTYLNEYFFLRDNRERALEAGVDGFVDKPIMMTRVRELAWEGWEG